MCLFELAKSQPTQRTAFSCSSRRSAAFKSCRIDGWAAFISAARKKSASVRTQASLHLHSACLARPHLLSARSEDRQSGPLPAPSPAHMLPQASPPQPPCPCSAVDGLQGTCCGAPPNPTCALAGPRPSPPTSSRPRLPCAHTPVPPPAPRCRIL